LDFVGFGGVSGMFDADLERQGFIEERYVLKKMGRRKPGSLAGSR
jgi:hypothetical protein